MANLTPQQERINRDHRDHEIRNILTDPNCIECKRIYNRPPSSFSTSRSSAYNAVHGTRLVNDEALDQMLANELEVKRLLQKAAGIK